MLNILWAVMMAAGLIWGAFHGTLSEVTNGALEAAREAVTLGITMLGVMSFWTGILEIGRKSGLMEALAEKMYPLLHALFPRIPRGHPALESICANVTANLLGLGCHTGRAESHGRTGGSGGGAAQEKGQPGSEKGHCQ